MKRIFVLMVMVVAMVVAAGSVVAAGENGFPTNKGYKSFSADGGGACQFDGEFNIKCITPDRQYVIVNIPLCLGDRGRVWRAFATQWIVVKGEWVRIEGSLNSREAEETLISDDGKYIVARFKLHPGGDGKYSFRFYPREDLDGQWGRFYTTNPKSPWAMEDSLGNLCPQMVIDVNKSTRDYARKYIDVDITTDENIRRDWSAYYNNNR